MGVIRGIIIMWELAEGLAIDGEKIAKMENLSKYVGGGIIKNVCSVRKTSFCRENRTAQGHEFRAGYQAALCL